MAAGLRQGLYELTRFPPGGNARESTVAAMILLSDGSPTRTLSGGSPVDCDSTHPEYCGDARNDTMDQAWEAANRGVVVYTIFVGDEESALDHALMLQWIADLTEDRRLDGSLRQLA